MAAGDTYQVGPTSVADTGTLSAETSAGVEAIIHNVIVPDGTAAGLDLEWGDGTTWIVVREDVTTSLVDFHFHVGENATDGLNYVRLVNNTGGSLDLGFDGIEV